jgi:glycosyltransferase involved in cell wall biosynthesis
MHYEFSNLEIAKWAEYYLGQKTSFHQASWLSGRVTENPKDILLGHLTWDTRSPGDRSRMGKLLRNWVKDNALSTEEAAHPNTYILTPWVPVFPPEWTGNMPHLESQLLSARKILALCGEIWIDRTLQKSDGSIQARVKHKLVQFNMGLSVKHFRLVKTRFNPVGKRQLLHISNLAHYKGFDITCASLQGVDTTLHVASSSIQAKAGFLQARSETGTIGFNFLGIVDNDDDAFNQWVVATCDFYIHTARMDAQATTILENCARGLIPLVTPESGFACPEAIYLSGNPTENRRIIDWALRLPENELLMRSRRIRNRIEKEHDWATIFQRIWDTITDDMAT